MNQDNCSLPFQSHQLPADATYHTLWELELPKDFSLQEWLRVLCDMFDCVIAYLRNARNAATNCLLAYS